ncbi:MAG TPA: hypothetical protein VMT15_00025 [Bryobacteraceae bacterium]|nr:hypothetical protein [Bryobacteraceae bacterium]
MSVVALQYLGSVGDDPVEPNFLISHAPFYGFRRRYVVGSHGCEECVLVVPPQAHGLNLAQGALDAMSGLDADWETLGSEPPNARSRDLALGVLDRSFLMGRVRPTYTTASAEGGVGIIYRSQDKYAAIECLNSGEMWLLWYDQQGNPLSREIDANAVAIEAALDQVSALHADA